MKRKEIIIVILIVLLIISGATIIILGNELRNSKNKTNVENNNVEKDISSGAIKFKYEYENLNDKKTSSGETYKKLDINIDNPIKYVTLNQLVNIVENDEAYVYISSPSCPFCRATVEILLQVAKELKIDTIYYYDAFKDNDEENYNELMSKLKDKEIVTINDSGNKTWGIPILLKTSGGQVVSKARGVSYQLNDGQSPHDSLTEDQKKQVYDRYYEALTVE